MKLSELLQGVEVLTSTAPATWDITGVAYDSREVQPGDVFVAISGFATDGNRYIDKAMARGARLVVTERIPTEPAPYVQVPSARRALAQMGANWYGHPAERMTMVGVTGTNGKTSVTLLLKSVLEQVTGARVGLVGTIQNMIGQEALPTERTTPESFALQGLLARMAAAHRRSLGSPVGRRSHFQACAARSRAHRRGRVRLAKYALSARQLPRQRKAAHLPAAFPGEHSLPRARAAAAVRSMPVQVTETGSPRQKSTAVRAGSASPCQRRRASQFRRPWSHIPRDGAASSWQKPLQLPVCKA